MEGCAGMADDMHMYDKVGSHGRGDKLLSDTTENATSFDDKQKYMSLLGSQPEGTSEYQEPQQYAKDARAAGKDEVKQMKRCQCVLSSLLVILFLVTILSLSLAAYGLQRSLVSTSLITANVLSLQNQPSKDVYK